MAKEKEKDNEKKKKKTEKTKRSGQMKGHPKEQCAAAVRPSRKKQDRERASNYTRCADFRLAVCVHPCYEGTYSSYLFSPETVSSFHFCTDEPQGARRPFT